MRGWLGMTSGSPLPLRLHTGGRISLRLFEHQSSKKADPSSEGSASGAEVHSFLQVAVVYLDIKGQRVQDPDRAPCGFYFPPLRLSLLPLRTALAPLGMCLLQKWRNEKF